MTCIVTLHNDIEHKDIAEVFRQALEDWLNSGVLPEIFGNYGAWESNAALCLSFVYKMHIKMPPEKPWKKSTPQMDRKSNSYLVFSRHWTDFNNIQIISIMSPDAHEKARTTFLTELERRAEEFQNS